MSQGSREKITNRNATHIIKVKSNGTGKGKSDGSKMLTIEQIPKKISFFK